MTTPNSKPVEDTGSTEHVQTHRLSFGDKQLVVTIATNHGGSKASISGLFGLEQSMPYASVEEARGHWEHLVKIGWEHLD
jgi:hypothetical protein